MSDPHKYTVGWICAITTEYVAAQAFLEDKHEKPEYVNPHDNNNYTLGRIGQHNIVIAVLPNGEYGISSAAGVARDMLHSFPNVRIGLMVGIGGGAPSAKHDIRLGDVVVGISNNGEGSVVQYDFGKTIQGQGFQETGFLNQAPTLLRTAVSGLMAEYESEGNQIQEAIDSALAKRPRLRKKYKRPEASSDRLYQPMVIHPAKGEAECSAFCGNDPLKLITRPERGEDDDDPTIHYGLIASANTLMKDALVRNQYIAERDVLCFEMEAAGLLNHFPCLVIRGICDYSDSHKNKEWQGYAAMTAAAYAKDLLYQIAPNRIEAEKKLNDTLSGFYKTAEEHRDIAKEQLQIHKDLAKARLSDEEKECHQVFRLTPKNKDATYEWYKGRIEKRVENTCLWFLRHENFQKWLKQESGPLLVTADPGCGKSVLAKFLIDHGLPQSATATICYFFFKDQDQNTSRQALCAVLHQLFFHKPALLKYAMPQFYTNGQGLSESTESLWQILGDAISDPEAGPIIIVLDALDECAEYEFANLIQNIKNQFCSSHSGSKLRYLLTCRPYEQITLQFHGLLSSFPDIRIPGEEESKIITQEVNHVITHQVNQLSMKKNLTSQVKNHLLTKLQETSHRTYLWIYLIFKHLEKEDFKKTLNGIELAITTLPKSINEAYEQILSKSKERLVVHKALSIVLAANRPLTLLEMNIAMNIDKSSQTLHDLDLEDEDDFKLRLRSLCGLFISVYHNRIYFLHQSAREFLLAESASPATIPSSLSWHHSITARHAHNILAELCVIYLDLFNSNDAPLIYVGKRVSHFNYVTPVEFLYYSATKWCEHFRIADITDGAAILPLAMRICDPDSKSYSIWLKIYKHTHKGLTENFTDLMLASYFGHTAIVKLCLEKGSNIEAENYYGSTSLLLAAQNGHEAIVKLLLEKGANTEAKEHYGRTPLWLAVQNGHETVVELLLKKGANIDASDQESSTPLLCAAENGPEAIVKLLLEKGANMEASDQEGYTPLLYAAGNGTEAIVKLLLEKGANTEAKEHYGRTPLWLAVQNGHETVVELLLKKGANVDASAQEGQTLLFWAVKNRDEAMLKLLLEQGANIEAMDNNGWTPLWWAAEHGDEAMVELLLEKAPEIEAKDRYRYL